MRVIHLIATAALVPFVTGCYTLHPVRGDAALVGKRVAFDVNDAGRVALGGLIGPEIAQIEGRLLSNGSEEYLLAISTVRLLRGGEQVWAGEHVRIRPEHIAAAHERRFSRGRTAALVAVAAGGVATFLIGRSLVGEGSENPRLPTDTASTRIVRP